MSIHMFSSRIKKTIDILWLKKKKKNLPRGMRNKKNT